MLGFRLQRRQVLDDEERLRLRHVQIGCDRRCCGSRGRFDACEEVDPRLLGSAQRLPGPTWRAWWRSDEVWLPRVLQRRFAAEMLADPVRATRRRRRERTWRLVVWIAVTAPWECSRHPRSAAIEFEIARILRTARTLRPTGPPTPPTVPVACYDPAGAIDLLASTEWGFGHPTIWRLFVKRISIACLIVLVATSAFVQAQQAVPTIPFESVPNPLKLPNDVHFGEIGGVAVNSKGNVFVFSRGNSTGPA